MAEKCSITPLETCEESAICPFMSIAMQEKTTCLSDNCAMWVNHWDEGMHDTTGWGHCGLVHPKHHRMVIPSD